MFDTVNRSGRPPFARYRHLALTMTATAALLTYSRDGWSAPQGGDVVSGSATIGQSGTATTIDQSSNRAIINWQSFSVGAAESVTFNQPSTSSVTLNRVVGNEKSVIDGALSANGQVFLVNSAGVLVGKGASINTAGFAASTLDISNADFNAGNYVFQAADDGTGSVVNLGAITVTPGGYVVLLGKTVSNQGVIAATRGTVALASGDKVSLNFNGDSLLSVTVDQGALDALVENKQAIYADGGVVILTAKAAEGLLSAQVNNDGLIQARTIDDITGKITVLAENGTTRVGGTLDASAPNGGDGGAIETSGGTVDVLDGAIISTLAADGVTGLWLIDPNDFTIAVSGGNMTGAQVAAMLASTNFAITTSTMGTAGGNGDIKVNDAVGWGADTTLILTAERNIEINKAVTATGANAGLVLTAGTDINVNAPVTLAGDNAALALTYGNAYNILTRARYSGTTLDSSGSPIAQTDTSGGVHGSITFTACADTASCANTKLKINGVDYTLIGSLAQLDGLDGVDATTGSGTATAVVGNYALAKDLSAIAGTTYVTSLINTFGGTTASTLTGLGHTVDGVTINSAASDVGLIGQTYADNTGTGSIVTLRDIGVTNFTLTNSTSGSGYGALLGSSNSVYLTVKNAYSTGSITAGSRVGGLIGATYNYGYSTIDSSYSDVTVKSTGSAGGLLGYGGGSSSVLPLSTVNAIYWRVGNALYTYGFNTTVTNSHATGSVSANTAIATSAANMGGLVGQFYGHGKVANSYATGKVEAHATTDGITDYAAMNIGGLIGSIGAGSTAFANSVTNSYATGAVIGGYYVGGLVGYSDGGNCTSIVPVCGTTFTNTWASGSVNANSAFNGSTKYVGAGGLIGSAVSATISNSHASGNVTQALTEGYQSTQTASVQSVGGLVGNAGGTSTITNSSATGNVTTGNSVNYTGGLVGSGGTVVNSTASGNVTTGTWSYYVGGLAGSASAISGSSASGRVTSGDYSRYVGGVQGSGGTIANSIASGAVTVGNNAWYVGGLAGYSGAITNSSSSGNVTTGTSANYVGGLVGWGLSTITGSSASGNVTATDNSAYVGGLAGRASGTISNSNASGDVTGGSNVGALAGRAASIVNSGATGRVRTAAGTGGLYGMATGTVTNSRYDDVKTRAAADAAAAAAALAARTREAALSSAGAQSAGAMASATAQPDVAVAGQPMVSADGSIAVEDSASYGTDIRSIDVNGEHFDLTGDSKDKDDERKAAH